jgi:hypothetical protein
MRAQRRSVRAVKPSSRPCTDRAALLTRRLAGMTRRYVRRRRPPSLQPITGFAAARLH